MGPYSEGRRDLIDISTGYQAHILSLQIAIICTKDQSFPASSQKIQTERTKVDEVEHIDSSHYPQLSMPKELAAMLLELTNVRK